MKTIHIGVLSGTSMDAVDAAAFCFERAYAPVARHSMADALSKTIVARIKDA